MLVNSHTAIAQDVLDTGLIGELRPATRLEDEPDFPAYFCSSIGEQPTFGFGMARSSALAQLKAAAECMERYALNLPLEKYHTVEPSETCLEAFVNCVLVSTTVDTIQWWPVSRLRNNTVGALPYQLLSTGPLTEPRIVSQRNSTGTAFGRKGTGHALESAIYELIERYHVQKALHTNTPWTIITELPTQLTRLVEYVASYGLSVHLVHNPTSFGIYVVSAFAIDQNDRGLALTAGSCSGLKLEDVILKAILESLQSRSSRRQYFADPTTLERELNSPASTLGQAAYWSLPDNLQPITTRLNQAVSVAYEQINGTGFSNFDKLYTDLVRRNDLFVADITPMPISQAGFEVIRVLEPELCRSTVFNEPALPVPSPFA